MKLNQAQIQQLEATGSRAQDWASVEVDTGFDPSQVDACRFEGAVRIGSGARLSRTRVRDYSIGDRAQVTDSTLHGSTEPVHAAAVNENGGRAVTISAKLSAQSAYLMAFYRHRPRLIAALERILVAPAAHIAAGARVEGAVLRDTTVLEGARVGAGVQLERVFVGENCVLDKGFTATDSLFFANSHCEAGEAVSVFAGPHTVSHHKASLLIAGYFCFFNAGSAANQSNHLFKTGAIHQAIHRRGCKFGSGTYIMAPAVEAPFTLVLGRHTAHHDTSAFPFSYLIEQEGRSILLPGANLATAGTARDLRKWPERDKRILKRDRVDYNPCNPYLAGAIVEAVNALNALSDHPAEIYHAGNTTIRAVQLTRSLTLYNKALVAMLGSMLSKGTTDPRGEGRWVDLAGQYVPQNEAERICSSIERGEIASAEQLEAEFNLLFQQKDDLARGWAEALLAQLLGHAPTQTDIADAIEAGRARAQELKILAEQDAARDHAEAMKVGYGIDDPAARDEDFAAVQTL